MGALRLACRSTHILTLLSAAAACSIFPNSVCSSTAKSLQEKLENVVVARDILALDSVNFTTTYASMDDSNSHRPTLSKPLRILCFGDSLTAGYMSTNPERYPYGDTLHTELAHMLSVPLSMLHVDIDGFSGIGYSPKFKGSILTRPCR